MLKCKDNCQEKNRNRMYTVQTIGGKNSSNSKSVKTDGQTGKTNTDFFKQDT